MKITLIIATIVALVAAAPTPEPIENAAVSIVKRTSCSTEGGYCSGGAGSCKVLRCYPGYCVTYSYPNATGC